MTRPDDALGIVLAGGGNTRYGSHKAFATVGGRSVIDRVLETLGACACQVGIVANEPEAYESLGLPIRPDIEPGLGALGGIRTAISWAAELGLDQAVVLACDMPFVPPGLLSVIAAAGDRHAASVPSSPGPRGLEPLCAAYGVGCLKAVEAALSAGDRAVISFFPAVEVRVLDVARVAEFGDPDRMFLNINRPSDRLRAEGLADSPDGGFQ